jgi:NIMA (never in mitosis gene a)-related kinase 8
LFFAKNYHFNISSSRYEYVHKEATNKDVMKTSSIFGTVMKTKAISEQFKETKPPIVERSVLYQLKSFGASTSLDPLHLPPTIRIVQVATYGSHFIAVSSEGSVYTWGEGNKGQLGHNAIETWKHFPTKVDHLRKYMVIG